LTSDRRRTRRPGAGDDDGADLAIARELVEGGVEALHHLAVTRLSGWLSSSMRETAPR